MLRESHSVVLPFDDTVCPGQRGARSRSLAYVWHQSRFFASLLLRRPFSRRTYQQLVEPWGLFEIVPGLLYRSAEPRAMHLAHLDRLGIKTLVCVKRTLPHVRTLAHAASHDLHVARIDLGPDGNIMPQAIQRAVDAVTQPGLGTVLLHCDGGRHRTGIVAAALRRAQGWSLERTLDEYERLAAPTPRVSDSAAIVRYFAYVAQREAEK